MTTPQVMITQPLVSMHCMPILPVHLIQLLVVAHWKPTPRVVIIQLWDYILFVQIPQVIRILQLVKYPCWKIQLVVETLLLVTTLYVTTPLVKEIQQLVLVH